LARGGGTLRRPRSQLIVAGTVVLVAAFLAVLLGSRRNAFDVVVAVGIGLFGASILVEPFLRRQAA
jgi:hypothetical protein